MSHLYILSGHKAVQTTDVEDWKHWYDCADRRVAETRDGTCMISTVFLGQDCQPGNGPPLLFETVVFGGSLDGMSWLGTTWSDAEKQHRDVCQMLGVRHD